MTLLIRATALFVATLMIGSVLADKIDDATEVSLGTAITVFGLAFGAWAVVLGWVMFVIRREFGELRGFVREESERRRESDERAHQDRLQLERRLTEIESYWRHVVNNHGVTQPR
jgi:hypothetical protein